MEILKQYKKIIENIHGKIAQREPLSQEDKFAYYEAVHYIDLHNFHESEGQPVDARKGLYTAVVDSHRKLHTIEKRIMGDHFKEFGIHGPAIDLENRRAYLTGLDGSTQ
ncbi:hypothetical protein J4218_00310 [Candidatus Pacearchaeota archaeon]|nr:hypothetical protein [Candidatus Pacearchaeota archaeon]